MQIFNNDVLNLAINKDGDFSESDIRNIIAIAINSSFYIPAKTDNNVDINLVEGVDPEILKKKNVAFPCISYGDDNKLRLLPVFTDMDEFKKYLDNGHKGNPYIIEFGALANLIESTEQYDGFMLNMYGRALPFTRDILSTIYDLIDKE